MVQNAKEFNEKGSEIHEDAERLRKASSNWMTKNNPAYKINGYTPKMTPLPGEDLEEADSDEEAEPEIELPKRKGRPPKNPKAHALRKSATPSLSESQYGGVSFAGLTFQQAQEKIVDDIIHYKEDPELVDSLSHIIRRVLTMVGMIIVPSKSSWRSLIGLCIRITTLSFSILSLSQPCGSM